MKNHPPSVSIIIPTYNDNKFYLIEAIESALNQTYKPIEIIVVDDGSTDNTKEVLKDYIEQKKIIYLYQSNKERSCARNTGILKATGNYIIFLDADDILLPEYVEKGVMLFLKNENANILFSKPSFFYKDDKKLTYKTEIPDLEGDPVKKIILRNYFPIHSLIFQRDLFLNERFDESFNQCEDWDVLIRLSLKGAHFFLNEGYFTLTRIHGKNMSFDKTGMFNKGIMVIDKIITIIEQSKRKDKNDLISLCYISKAKQELLIDKISNAIRSVNKALNFSRKDIYIKLVTLIRAIAYIIPFIKKLDKFRIERNDLYKKLNKI